MARADEKRATEWRLAAQAAQAARAAGAAREARRGQRGIEILRGGDGAGPDTGQVIDLEVPICSN